MKKMMTALLTATTLFAFALPASAHVTVWPKVSTTGAYEKYTVRVPSEKNASTTKVQVEFPAGVTISSVEPTPGWNYSFATDASGRNTGITWTAIADGGVKPHEFQEFNIMGANPKTPGSIAWKAHQTYSDGSVVDWTGDSASQTPASVTTINAAGAASTGAAQQPTATTPATPAATSNGSNNTLPIVLSAIALLVALISLFRKNSAKK